MSPQTNPASSPVPPIKPPRAEPLRVEPLRVEALPQPDDQIEALPPDPNPPFAQHKPKFCRVCGAPWQTHWTECEACKTSRQQAVSQMGVPAGGEEMRSIKSAMALYFILLAICVAGLIASLAKAQELSVDMWVSGTLSLAILIWSIFTWRDVLPPLARFPRLGWSAAGVAMGLATFAVAIGVIRGLQKLLHLPDEAMSSPYLSAGYGWLTVVAMVAVQPAIFEELAFRGAVLGALLRPLRPAEAVLVGAMMFMILHLAPMRFPHTFAMGVAAGFLRVRSGSLYPCIILHFTHNGLCVLSEWAKV